MSILRMSHVGLCVSNLARSTAFYRDQLGFSEMSSVAVAGEPAATLLELPDVELEAVYLERDGCAIELLDFRRPGVASGDTPRPMNRLGLTHLSLRVDEFERTVEELRAAGVTIRESTSIHNRVFGARAVMIADPDGLQIELYEAPGDPEKPPGA
jgi:glyoxylase I family protein